MRFLLDHNEQASSFKDTYGELYDKVEWVYGNYSDEKEMNSVMEGVTHVIHTAGHIPSTKTKVTDEDMVKEAVNGIKIILNFCFQTVLKN